MYVERDEYFQNEHLCNHNPDLKLEHTKPQKPSVCPSQSKTLPPSRENCSYNVYGNYFLAFF